MCFLFFASLRMEFCVDGFAFKLSQGLTGITSRTSQFSSNCLIFPHIVASALRHMKELLILLSR